MGPLGQARPTFLLPLGVEEEVGDGAALEELEELDAEAAALEVGAGLGAAEVVGATEGATEDADDADDADELGAADALKLPEGRGLQRLVNEDAVELSWRFLLLKRERRAITSWWTWRFTFWWLPAARALTWVPVKVAASTASEVRVRRLMSLDAMTG